MPSQSRDATNIYALLIGINCYLPNRLPDGTFYRSLSGCVPDILLVERYLRDELGLPEANIIRLTASDAPDPSDPRPPEPTERWPTYVNIVSAFRRLADAARPGDQIYVHYSGHGGRVTTLPAHSALIPGKVLDEALVPADIGNSEAQYIRDIELAFLLQEMVDKGLLVTVVLDSCHSASATRGLRSEEEADGRQMRGVFTIDTARPAARSLVADDAALIENWRRVSPPVMRDLTVGSGWLPDPKGYVLLAACRAHEGAYEFPFDGRQKQGALTYWLLDSLREFGTGVSYRTLHRRVHAKIHAQFEKQTAQLEGEGDRVVFGREAVPTPNAFTVIKVDETARQLTLNAGRVHGLRAGSRLAVYRADAAPGSRARTAVVELAEPGVTSSPARIVRRRGSESISLGDQAVLLAPGTDAPRRAVRLLPPRGVGVEAARAASALREVEWLLRRYGGRHVRSARPEEACDFTVSVDARGVYRILDADAQEVPNLRPEIHVGHPEATAQVVRRVSHLSQYRNVRELTNDDPQSPLARHFAVGLVVPSSGDGRGGAPPHDGPPGVHHLRVNDLAYLRARNDGEHVLNVTVLDLRPDWGIVQVFPSRSGLFETLEPGRELSVPLRADLPGDYREGTDVLKVFATVEPADFKCLELPPLDRPEAASPHALRTTSAAAGVGTLDDLEAATRDMSANVSLGEDWAAPCVEVRIRRD